MSTSAFFSSDDPITRKLDCVSISTSNEDLESTYDIHHCVQWIKDNNFISVALQFPDHLLVDAPKVARYIQDKVPNASVFILGDTSYGSCCVDEVGAQHYDADSIIHYGSACLSPTTRLPVLYVFGRSLLDLHDCVSKICQECSDAAMKAVLLYDTKYAFVVGEVFHQLQNCLPHLVLSKLSVLSCNNSNQESVLYKSMYPNSIHSMAHGDTDCSLLNRCGRVICLPEGDHIEDYIFIFLGNPEGATVINLMMNFNMSPFYSYEPETSTCQRIALNVNRALMKRYYLIERAKDANIVGILIGTLGVAKYRDILDHLKALLKKAGKKSYTFVVGKLNTPKLANFAEVEVYVLVSCPESCLFNQSDFHCPIVTPFEMEVACNKAREWTGDYTTDFSTLLPGSSMHIQAPDMENDEDVVDVSLISNRLRIIGERKPPETGASSQEVVVRDTMTVVTAAENAGEFLSMRSWQGLEQKLGQTPVTKVMEGQTGIAASYNHEPTS